MDIRHWLIGFRSGEYNQILMRLRRSGFLLAKGDLQVYSLQVLLQ